MSRAPRGARGLKRLHSSPREQPCRTPSRTGLLLAADQQRSQATIARPVPLYSGTSGRGTSAPGPTTVVHSRTRQLVTSPYIT